MFNSITQYYKKISEAEAAARRELEFSKMQKMDSETLLRQIETMELYDQECERRKKRTFGEYGSDDYVPTSGLIQDLLPYTPYSDPSLSKVDAVRYHIDELLDEELDDPPAGYKKSAVSPRPGNWLQIGLEFSGGASIKNLCKEYPEVARDKHGDLVSEDCIRMRLSRWANQANQWQKQALIQQSASSSSSSAQYPPFMKIKFGGKAPDYGIEIDYLLANRILARVSLGLSIDNQVARMLLIELLQSNEMMHLLKENGGNNTFGDSWAHRFFKRHNLYSRIATTKMREIPADFYAKQEQYIKVFCRAMAQYNIRNRQLILAMDETNAQLVSPAKRTRALKGTKRVRLIGIGHEKAQITTTITVAAKL